MKEIKFPTILVVHPDIYNCKEIFTVTGIKENEVLLTGDWSGGVVKDCKQSCWFDKKGCIVIPPVGVQVQVKDKHGNCAIAQIEWTVSGKLYWVNAVGDYEITHFVDWEYLKSF